MNEKKANKIRNLRKKEPYIKWSAVLRLEDIVPKRGRHDTEYAVLYIDGGGSIVSSIDIAQKLALFEFYEFSGKVKQTKGGTFLSVSTCKMSESYKDTPLKANQSQLDEVLPY